MVAQGRLTVRATDVAHDAVQDVMHAGVLVPAGRQIAFAHHVLFDHAAGRFYLAGNDTARLKRQLAGREGLGLMLGPALRFAMEEVWETDRPGRPTTWTFLSDLSSAATPEPVMLSIALRTAAENVAAAADVGGLTALIEGQNDFRVVAKLVGQLARFLGLAIMERGGLSSPAALAWSELAGVVARRSAADPYMADAGRFLLMTLSEHGDFTEPAFLSSFGTAARTLLATAWATDTPHDFVVTAGIRLVTKSFGSDPQASRTLLARILEPKNLAERAAKDVPWLAEGVAEIIPHDPSFVAQIYGTVFDYEVTDEDSTWVGGSAPAPDIDQAAGLPTRPLAPQSGPAAVPRRRSGWRDPGRHRRRERPGRRQEPRPLGAPRGRRSDGRKRRQGGRRPAVPAGLARGRRHRRGAAARLRNLPPGDLARGVSERGQGGLGDGPTHPRRIAPPCGDRGGYLDG